MLACYGISIISLQTPLYYTFSDTQHLSEFSSTYMTTSILHGGDGKGINTPSVKRQRQSPIGMHCDAPTQASKLQSAAAADARCGHPFHFIVVCFDNGLRYLLVSNWTKI